MRRGLSVLLLSSFVLVACEQITGESPQKALETKALENKVFDAKAIGYACRVSQKAPEDCMKENETHSPSSILTGWKEADKEIHDKVIDPTMGISRPALVAPLSAAAPTPASPNQKPAVSKKAKQ